MRAGGELKCPAGTVYIPKGQFEGQAIGEMCVDQGEFTVTMGAELKIKHPELDIPLLPPIFIFQRPKQPMVNVSGTQAAKICEARGMRLLTPVEWAYAASGPNRFEHSTRTGKLEEPGIHWCSDSKDWPKNCPKGTRDVGAAAGHYVEWGGQELFEMNGNVEEWTYDPGRKQYFLSGGSWGDDFAGFVRAAYRLYYHPGYRFSFFGFRCAVSPEDPKLFVNSFPLENVWVGSEIGEI